MFNVVLYQPEIPQNTGNIGRTCVAIGAKLWFVRPMGFRLDSTQIRRSGLDYWEHLQWEAVDQWTDLLERLPNANFWLLTKSAKKSIYEAKFQPNDVFVFGNESQGLPASIHAQFANNRLSLPMTGPVRSLNLATSVGITVYEALRQSQSLSPKS